MTDWVKQEIKRPYHPVSQLFPLMQGAEFEQLKVDIDANGLLEAIWLHPDGSIIDGRNRHRACIEIGTEPRFREWNSNNGSLVTFVVSANLHRRHLTSSQRAVIALDILPMLEEEAKERQRLGKQKLAYPEEAGQARNQAAELFNTNHLYVQGAKALASEAPDLLSEVRRGEKTIPQAKRELVRRQRTEAPPLPTGKYRVIYADPPWQYGNVGIIGETDNYGHVHRHYPSMPTGQLCEMGRDIEGMVDDDAVLFLWVTAPMLEDGFRVVRAWGFKYKTCFVWDKIKHNFGHYNSVRHEFLFVCTRGSCTPDVLKLFDSVQSVERSDRHSEKPEEFRKIIETLYIHGDRIELFGRKEVDGWDVWGNEPIG